MRSQTILIWGFGREGRAAIDFLSAQDPRRSFVICDDEMVSKAATKNQWPIVAESQITTRWCRDAKIDLVVRSPGVSPYKAAFQLFDELSIPITTGTNLWLSENQDVTTIAVTGTKGKSTVSALINFMLSELGFDTNLAGNLGIPLLLVAPSKDFSVLELSSYQIADLSCPVSFAVFTNLLQEHIPWHGSLEKYHEDKLRMALVSPRAKIIYSSQESALDAKFSHFKNTVQAHRSGVAVTDRTVFLNGAKIGVNFGLQGRHNHDNLTLAMATVFEAIGIPKPHRPINFGDFNSLPHRLTEYNLSNGLLAVDDSLSTIPESTVAALEIYSTHPTHLIVGGADRNISFGPLTDYLANIKLRSVSFTGPAGSRMYEEGGYKLNYETNLVKTLDEAFAQLEGTVLQGDTILLSPSAPSFDEFVDYSERGKRFVELASALSLT